jgi:hypothetical protein
MAERYAAIRACYYSDGVFRHKYFGVGELLPEGWKHDANGCTHFAPVSDAKKIIRSGKHTQRAMTAGDDERSTDQIRIDLEALMKKKVPPSWNRRKMWGELNKLETAMAKDAQTNPKEK